MTELKFEPDKTITAMLSGEKEMIQFSETLDPKDKKVEDWMGEVENMMFTTVRDVLKFSVDDYKLRSRPDWIKKHPGQCVLNGS
jgi:dynein heavy chain